MESKRRGRPQQHREVVWFGMKITPEERQKIRTLASRRGKPAACAIMELIHQAVEEDASRPTARELMRLSPQERRRLLRAQAKDAAKYYREDPDLHSSGDEDIVEY